MSPLSGFLAVIVSLTAILVAYLTKQFQNENLNYSSSNQMKNTNTKVQTIEKEKVVAETLNGRFAMLGLIAAVGAYLTKQFRNANLNYLTSNPMKNSNPKVKTIEKEKVVAETLNGRFAMLGLIAAVGAYLTTGQIIPGFV